MNDIEVLERKIKKCDECKLKECITCEISWSEIKAIENLLKERQSDKERIEQYDKLKGKIREQLDKLDLDYEEQESWDELSGSTAITLFCKQLLKGE